MQACVNSTSSEVTEDGASVTWYIPEHQPAQATVQPAGVIPSDRIRALAPTLCAAAQAMASTESVDFMVEVEGRRYRGHRTLSAQGVLYVLRSTLPNCPSLKDPALRYPKDLQVFALAKALSRGGLLLISGKTGTGKSTTVAAIVDSRLRAFGGVCVAIEDPPEYPLQGSHGAGYCMQIPAQDGDYSRAIRSSLRCYPAGVSETILMLGEIRDHDTAAEALTAALNGHLVIATVHSETLVGALDRVATLAAKRLSHDESRQLLSRTLRLAIHQNLHNRTLAVTYLVSKEYGKGGVVGAIANNATGQLRGEVDRQNQLIKRGEYDAL